jgi:phosphoribosylformylglycinamidine synthase subunit PurQ / glutaminase
MAKTNEGDICMKPKAAVLKTEGTNCDDEAIFALNLAGANANLVHVNDLREKKENLKEYQILIFPGGFAYGDDVASGKILAVEVTSFLSEELQRFVNRKSTLTLGICNGFQVLVRTGLLPFGNMGKMDATLTNNDSGHFECRWTDIKTEKSKCVFLQGEYGIRHVAVNHGEGKFFTNDKVLKKVEDQDLVVFRYVDSAGSPTQQYPQNPNGALHAIAGVTDPTGRILGLMPHPEKFVLTTQYPNWRREKIEKPHGTFIFEEMVNFVKKS